MGYTTLCVKALRFEICIKSKKRFIQVSCPSRFFLNLNLLFFLGIEMESFHRSLYPVCFPENSEIGLETTFICLSQYQVLPLIYFTFCLLAFSICTVCTPSHKIQADTFVKLSTKWNRYSLRNTFETNLLQDAY